MIFAAARAKKNDLLVVPFLAREKRGRARL